MSVKPSEVINNGPRMKLECNSLFTHTPLCKIHFHFRVFGQFLPEISQNFMDSTTMGVKHFEVVKRRSHANKQWSPDEIRV